MEITKKTFYAVLDANGICKDAGTAEPSTDSASKATIDAPVGGTLRTDFESEVDAMAFARENGLESSLLDGTQA